MKRHRLEADRSPGTITGIAEATAERVRLGGEVLNAMAHAIAASEEVQRKFRGAVLALLSKIQVTLTEVQGAQLADLWAPGRMTDEKRAEYLRDVEERISTKSNEVGIGMVKYIYGFGEHPSPAARRGKRRDWSDWEI
jgi:hypothetical protein